MCKIHIWNIWESLKSLEGIFVKYEVVKLITVHRLTFCALFLFEMCNQVVYNCIGIVLFGLQHPCISKDYQRLYFTKKKIW